MRQGMPDNTHLRWTGHVNDWGYGIVTWHGRSRKVHDVVFEHYYGPVPEGLELDHVCRVRDCFSPWHLEIVTKRENILRAVPYRSQVLKRFCPLGHPYDEDNTYLYQGHRHCKECVRRRVRERRALLKVST